MKVHSKLGPKEVVAGGVSYVTDDNGCVDVPDDVGVSLCEQVDAWEPVKAVKAAKGEEN